MYIFIVSGCQALIEATVGCCEHKKAVYMAIIALPVIRVSFGLKMKRTGQPAKPAYMFHR